MSESTAHLGESPAQKSADPPPHLLLEDELFSHSVVRSLLDASPNTVVGMDPDGCIRYVNDWVLAVFGYRRDELIGKPVEMLVPSQLAHNHVTHRSDYASNPVPRPMGTGLTLFGQHKAGTQFPVEVTLTPVATQNGTWVFAAVIDVTARHIKESRIYSLNRVYLTLAQTNQAIVRATNSDSLLTDICHVLVEYGGFLGAWVGHEDASGTVQVTASAGSVQDYISRLNFPLDSDVPEGRGPGVMALRDGRSHYIGDFATDHLNSPWHQLVQPYGILAGAALTLRCGGEMVAVLTMYSADADIFDDQMRVLLEGMAVNASHALDTFQTQQELLHVATQRRQLLHRLVEAQEQERARIAADVHDDSVQALAAVDLRLGLLQRRIAVAAPELGEQVSALQVTVTTATDRLRELLFDLEPTSDDADIAGGLTEIAAHIFEETDISWQVVASAVPELPHAETSQALRVAKEAMSNVRSHANASSVMVTATASAGGVEFTIIDNGIGVDPATVTSPPGHRGLSTMVDRAEIAGGWCRIESEPGAGTTVRFWIPFVAEQTD